MAKAMHTHGYTLVFKIARAEICQPQIPGFLFKEQGFPLDRFLLFQTCKNALRPNTAFLRISARKRLFIASSGDPAVLGPIIPGATLVIQGVTLYNKQGRPLSAEIINVRNATLRPRQGNALK